MGLVFVPTPLGNLGDITLRALEALRTCELIVAEDTRVASRLLTLLGLPAKPMQSYREQNARLVTESILFRAADRLVVVVTDAGMPGISDPGRELVVAARAAGIGIEVLPGPSAFVCAAVLSGFVLDGFSFEGFVPRRDGERRRAFASSLERGSTSVWYESPARIAAALASLDAVAPTADVFVVRELSKRFEQQLYGTAASIRAELADPVRGEIVLVIGPFVSIAGERPQRSEIEAAIDAQLAAGTAPSAIAKDLARRFSLERSNVYRLVTERSRVTT